MTIMTKNLVERIRITRNWDYKQLRAYYLAPYVVIRNVSNTEHSKLLNSSVIQMARDASFMGKSFYDLLAQYIGDEPYKDNHHPELFALKDNLILLANYLLTHDKYLESHIPIDTIRKAEHRARVSILNMSFSLS